LSEPAQAPHTAGCPSPSPATTSPDWPPSRATAPRTRSAVITVNPATPREPYRVEGDRRPVKTIHDAAELAAERCESFDRGELA
jgi:hypothetical protein